MSKTMRWHQVRLRTLFLCVALVAVALTVWSAYVRPYEGQRETREAISAAGGVYEMRGGPDWLQSILGAVNCQDITLVNLAEIEPEDALLARIADLPRLQVLVLGGLTIDDDALQYVPECDSLRAVILDSTLVSEDAIRALRDNRPGLHVSRCDRIAYRAWNRSPRLPLAELAPSVPPAKQFLVDRLGDAYFREIVAVRSHDLGGGYMMVPQKDQIAYLPTMHRLEDASFQSFEIEEELLDAVISNGGLKRFSFNDPNRFDMSFIGKLAAQTTLEDLSLRGIPVTDDDLQALGTLQSLKSLDVSHTLVADASGWPAWPLEKLQLDDTIIDNDDLAALARYPNLRELTLSFTEIDDDGVPELLALPKLESLQFRGAYLTEKSYEPLCLLPNLKTLALGSVPVLPVRLNAPEVWGPEPESWLHPFGPTGDKSDYKHQVTAVPFDAESFRPDPSAMNDLRAELRSAEWRREHPDELDFRSSRRSLHLDLFAGQAGIKRVALSASFVRDADLAHVASMPDLETLILADTWITDDGLRLLEGCQNLKELDLSGTYVTDAGMAHLANIETLESLILPSQTIRAAGARLLLELPRLRAVQFKERWLRTARGRHAPELTVNDLDAFQALAAALLMKYDHDGDGTVIFDDFSANPPEAGAQSLIDPTHMVTPSGSTASEPSRRVTPLELIEVFFDQQRVNRAARAEFRQRRNASQ